MWTKSIFAVAAALLFGIFLIPVSVSAAGADGTENTASETAGATAGWNGFHQSPDSQDWYYYKGGEVQRGLNSVIKGTVNGTNAWWHVVDGEVTYDTTIAKNSRGWWCIKDGKVDFTDNGFATNSNGTYKLTRGKVTFKENGVIKFGKYWYNLSRGRLVTGPTVAKNKNGWWYIDRTGKVDFGYNGFAKNSNGWWYCKGGKVQFGTNSVVKGAVNGTNGWWHVVKGKVAFDTTVAKNSNGWWYIEKGKVNFNADTVAKNSNGWWMIQNGKVNFKFTGIASNSNGLWYINNGKVDFSANGTFRSGEFLFDVNNGEAVEFGERVVQLVNSERRAQGLDPLKADTAMNKAAMVRAKELPSLFSHTRPDGSDCFTVLDELNISYGAAGENIAGGQPSPEGVVASWMYSPGHRANILNENFTRIGVACYYSPSSSWTYNWVQIFAN